MNTKSSLNFKRCLTYMFVTLSVIAGVSNYTPVSAVNVSRVSVAYILKLNEMLSQQESLSRIQAYLEKDSDENCFREFVAQSTGQSDIRIYAVYTAAVLLIIYFANNSLKKNDIWKSAVF